MSISDLIKLSAYNITRKKYTSFLLTLNFILIFVLFTLGFVYINSLKSSLKDMLTNQISKSSFTIPISVSDGSIYDQINEISNIIDKKSMSIYSCDTLMDILTRTENNEILSTDISYYMLKLDSQEYQGYNDYSYTFSYEGQKGPDKIDMDFTVRFDIDFLYFDSTYFLTENEMKEFNHKFADTKIILYGHSIKENNELLISDYMLRKFGIDEDSFDKLIGNKISIIYDSSEILSDYFIAGIISESVFRIESKRYSPQIILSAKSDLYENMDREQRFLVYCDAPSFDKINEYADKIRKLLNHELYINEYYVDMYSGLTYQDKIMSFIILLLGIVMGIAIMINMNNMLLFQFHQKSFYYGMLKVMGMNNKNQALLAFIELEYIQIISLCIAPFISILIAYILDSQLKSLLFISLYESPIQFLLPTMVLFITSPIVSSVLSISVSYNVGNKSSIQLMNTDI